MTSSTTYDYVLIDCHLLCYSSWWPVRELTNSSGTPTGLEFGFIKNVLTSVRRWIPAKLVLVWDGFPSRCNTIYPKVVVNGVESGYKSNRQKHEDKEAEPPWRPRLERMRKCFEPLVTTLYDPQTEADEQIARFVFKANREGKKCVIISKDKDMHQLVSENTHLCMGAEENLLTEVDIQELWGVPPHKVPLRRAVEGDGSDRIKGIPRMPKTVIIEMVNNSANISELILNAGKFTKSKTQLDKMMEPNDPITGELRGRDLIKRNYQLSEMLTQANLEPTISSLPEENLGDVTLVNSLIQEIESSTLMKRPEWRILQKDTTVMI